MDFIIELKMHRADDKVLALTQSNPRSVMRMPIPQGATYATVAGLMRPEQPIREMPEEPDPEPVDLSKIGVIAQAQNVGVIEWCPDAHAAARPTQVHVLMTIADDMHIALRLKSRAAVMDLVELLNKHADGVWPVEKS